MFWGQIMLKNVIFKKPGFLLNKKSITELKQMADLATNKRARYNLHTSYIDIPQKMIIALHKDTCVLPQHQNGSKKLYEMIEGKMCILFFNAYGKVVKKIILNRNNISDEGILYSFISSDWHATIPLSEYVVFLEIIETTFNQNSTVMANWVPDLDDISIFNDEEYNTFMNWRMNLISQQAD